MKKNNIKCFGFTLSEVLITLGIIGVIASMTIPSIIKDYRNKLYVSQLKKVYSQVQEAVLSAMEDENTDNFYETTSGATNAIYEVGFTYGKGPEYFFDNYFKKTNSVSDCQYYQSTPPAKPCVARSYKNLAGNQTTYIKFVNRCIQTNNGAAVCMARTATPPATIMIDVNGAAEPNIAGRDAFIFNIQSDGKLTDWATSDKCGVQAFNPAMGHLGDYASGCLNKIIENGWKMTY